MGQRLMSRPPKFVHGFLDRHGKARFYFRRPGFKRVPLPGLPWSPEFMAAYETAKAGERKEIGVMRSRPGSVAAAVGGYFGSLAFARLAKTTRHMRRGILERFRDEHGDKGIATLGRAHVERMVSQKANQPGTALNFLVSLRGLMHHAINVGLRADDPTLGVRGPSFKSSGFYSWTEEDIARFEAVYPIGTRPRLAFALLLYTAQRRADVVQLGRQHLRDGMLHIRQSKTGKPLAIPLHPELRMVLDATPSEHLTFLVTRAGRPFGAEAFTHWFKRKCREARLPPRASGHGLRKAACRRLAEAGCSAPIIAAISGHGSLREVQRYIEAAEQTRLAVQGIEAITRTRIGKLPA
jgi:integrase